MRGTLLNAATVAGGALAGLAVRGSFPHGLDEVVTHGLGLVTLGVAVKMILQGKNVLAMAGAVALGGIIGFLLGFQPVVEGLAGWVKHAVHSEEGGFVDGLVTTSVLFCVGPMTLLGCIQDGLEGKIEILALKSTLDCFAAFAFAAALGVGVLFTAAVVLVVQGAITLLSGVLKKWANDEDLMAEVTGVGGALLIGTSLSLLGLAKYPMADYLPALVVGPAIILVSANPNVKKRFEFMKRPMVEK